MKEINTRMTTVIDEPTYIEDLDRFLSNLAGESRPGPIDEAGLETGTTEDKRQYVSKISKLLEDRNQPCDSSSIQFRIGLINRLEKLLGTEFKSTKDFKQKTADFLKGCDGRQLPVSKRIRRARKKLKLSQKQLADLLGFKTQAAIALIEMGKRSPTKTVLEWLHGVES